MNCALEVVCVPVSDVDRAKAFYGEQLGFNVDYDNTHGEGYRVIQLTPPGSGCSIAIGSGEWTWKTGSPPLLQRQAPGSQQGLQLTVADIDATCAELAGRGVDVSQVMRWEDDAWIDGRGGEWNSFAFLNDPDGNGWILQERPRDRDDD
jgi:catechol 2,3-dioxygenase-like lactoylglutathione lyase family enzyme